MTNNIINNLAINPNYAKGFNNIKIIKYKINIKPKTKSNNFKYNNG